MAPQAFRHKKMLPALLLLSSLSLFPQNKVNKDEPSAQAPIDF